MTSRRASPARRREPAAAAAAPPPDSERRRDLSQRLLHFHDFPSFSLSLSLLICVLWCRSLCSSQSVFDFPSGFSSAQFVHPRVKLESSPTHRQPPSPDGWQIVEIMQKCNGICDLCVQIMCQPLWV